MLKKVIEWTDLGISPYREAWALQEKLREKRIASSAEADRLLLVEHPPVFTMGRKECTGDFFSTPEAIASEGIDIIKSNRGGRVTYHGPGQIVGYFICSLESLGMGIKDFVFAVEEICIRLLANFEIGAGRDPAHPGVWVGRSKIAAIGMNVQRGVTEHGFALNVDCSLSPYRHILACGIEDRGVTSMAKLLRAPPPTAEVKARLLAVAGEVLERVMTEFDVTSLESYADVKVSSSTCGVASSTGGSS